MQDGSGDVTQNRYGVSQVPETYVVDRRGRIVLHIRGPVNTSAFAGEFQRGVEKALRS